MVNEFLYPGATVGINSGCLSNQIGVIARQATKRVTLWDANMHRKYGL